MSAIQISISFIIRNSVSNSISSNLYTTSYFKTASRSCSQQSSKTSNRSATQSKTQQPTDFGQIMVWVMLRPQRNLRNNFSKQTLRKLVLRADGILTDEFSLYFIIITQTRFLYKTWNHISKKVFRQLPGKSKKGFGHLKTNNTCVDDIRT